jgi:hypothetical protein
MKAVVLGGFGDEGKLLFTKNVRVVLLSDGVREAGGR